MTFVRNHFYLMLTTVVGVMLMFARFAWGQDAAPEIVSETLVGTAGQIIWTLVYIGGAIVLAGVLWGLGKLALWISEKHAHTVWAGFVIRLAAAIEDELQLGWADLQGELTKARAPDSPGGEQITAGEQSRLFDIVWEGLKERYGGLSKLVSLGGKLLGGDPERIVKGMVTRRVADAVEGSTGGKPGPRRSVAPVNPSQP